MTPSGRGYTSAELGIDFVRELTHKVQRVCAKGRVIHCERQPASAEARSGGPDDTLDAHAPTTCAVFELRRA